MHSIGVDIGGTFTDLALVRESDGEVSLHKLLTTPADPSEAVIRGMAEILETAGVAIGDVRAFVHGTTLVTNALIERRGARTGALVTEGMTDLFDIRRETRYDLFDLRLTFPPPIVARRLRRGIAERIGADGRIRMPLDETAVLEAARELVAEGIEALAVCFLHSYRDPSHELRAAELVAAEFPGLAVSASAAVFPQAREYERWTTATMNAYVQPVVDRYLGLIEDRLGALGFSGRFHVMSSSGGMLTPAAARRFPIRMLESGPAAGVLMSAYHGRLQGIDNVLSFDMGGTTAKGALVRKGQPLKRYSLEVARMHEFKPGSGLPAEAPVIDMIEIGAGGGSIAGIDARGVIRVGPESAGADPGPACYGRGGTRPTLTDANLVLGYLGAGSFLGGRMALDLGRAEEAIAGSIAGPLGLDLMRAAWGIHEAINETVAGAFRVHASERGFDYRVASLVGFGGSGPVHACRIARKLGIPRVILPPGAGVMSALGLLQSPFAFELARTARVPLDGLTCATYRDGFAPIEAEVLGVLAEAGLSPEAITLNRRLDMRFQGQGHSIETAAGDSPEGLAERFLRDYRAVFSTAPDDEPLEIVTWKIEGRGPPPLGETEFRFAGPQGSGGALKGSRPVHVPGMGLEEVPVYERYLMGPGDEVIGPAIIEERESTLVLGPGDIARVDDRLNLVVEIAGKGAMA